MKQASQSLHKGFIITIDCGAISSELYKFNRRCGTLLYYHKHRKNDNPYQLFIGGQDIISHVNFSALSLWGKKNGIKCCAITEKALFLLNLGIKEYQNKTIRNTTENMILAIQESFINYRILMYM